MSDAERVTATVRQGDFIVSGVFERFADDRLELRSLTVEVDGHVLSPSTRMMVAKLTSRSLREVNLRPLFEEAYKKIGLAVKWPH